MKNNLLFFTLLCGGISSGVLICNPVSPGAAKKSEPLDIAFVDSFKAMRECKDGEIAITQINDLTTKISNEVKMDVEKLAKAENELKSKAESGMLKPTEYEKQARGLGKIKRDLEETYREKEEEIKMVRMQKLEEVAIKIEESVRVVAEQEGVDAVIDMTTGRVMYSKNNNKGDITSKTIDRANKKSAELLAQKSGSPAKEALAKGVPAPASRPAVAA